MTAWVSLQSGQRMRIVNAGGTVAAVELAAGFRAAHHQDAQVCTPYPAQYVPLFRLMEWT
jgi:hypothetical protein